MQNTAIVVCEYTEEQGAGWAVEQYGPQTVEINGAHYNERTTLSRWTNRDRAVTEGRTVAEQLGATLAIY